MVAKGRNSRWLHPLYRERWPLYVEKVTKAMAPHVKIYAPQNEPNGDLALGYISANYEWHQGYKAPFGMAKFDRDSKKRLLRPSALFYRGIIESSKASSIMDDVSTAPELPPGLIER